MTTGHNLESDELLTLLRDASLRPESIAEEMECAGAKAPTAAQIAAAREVLAALEAGSPQAELAARADALPELLALAVARAAGQRGAHDLLAALAVSKQKPLAKEAKRELQRLKQKGVQVPEIRPVAEAILRRAPEPAATPCFASSIDPFGERAVWWTRPARAGVDVVQAVISDLKGILAIDSLSLPRGSFRELVKRLPQQGAVSTAEIPREHARHLIAQAAEQGARNGFAPPHTYVQALPLLGAAPERPPAAPGADLLAEAGASGAQAPEDDARLLFADPLLRAWVPDEATLRTFALRVEEIATSQLFVDAAQRAEALERAAGDAAAAHFTPARRSLYAARLIEMAHVLRAVGRLPQARAAAATSSSLASDDGARGPFARMLFQHAFEGRLEETSAAGRPAARAD